MPQQTVTCANGIFTLPDRVLAALREMCPGGVVYVRQDEDMFTLSAAPITGGRRRQLTPQIHAAMFRTATRLMVVDLAEAWGIFAAEWRPPRRKRTQPGVE